jgi:hypothetical protein
MAPRVCIFCGGHGITAEDVWPRWLGRVFGRNRLPGPMTVSFSVSGAAREEMGWQAARIKIKAKVVCSRCNNGWMSDLEQAAEPILAPMLDVARPSVLDTAGQITAATWATKTAMLFEYARPIPGTEHFSDVDRKALMDDLVPPSGVVVWLGRFVGQNNFCDYLAHSLGSPNTRAQAGLVSTFLIGYLVVQVFAYHLRELGVRNRYRMKVRPGPWPQSLIQVWPVASPGLTWPPALASTRRTSPTSPSASPPARALRTAQTADTARSIRASKDSPL